MSITMHRYDNGLDGLAAFCDVCGKQITEYGFVLWDGQNVSDWIVVHQGTCDPGGRYTDSIPLDVEIFYLANSVSADLGKARETAALFASIG